MNRLFGYVVVALLQYSCSLPPCSLSCGRPSPPRQQPARHQAGEYSEGERHGLCPGDPVLGRRRQRRLHQELISTGISPITCCPGTGQWMLFDSTAWKDTTGIDGDASRSTPRIALNRQEFYVRAVDNDGNLDPTPAKKVLTTTRTAPPDHEDSCRPPKTRTSSSRNRSPTGGRASPVAFKATDQAKEGAIVAYAWSVDDGPWTWMTDTSVNLPPVGVQGRR